MQYNKPEDSLIDFDDQKMDLDIKINPDYYIHIALINAQKTFLKEDMTEGFMQYLMYIEHIQVLCKSANMLPDDYDEQVNKFNDGLNKEEKPIVNKVKTANFKLNLMMNEVFRRKALTAPLTYNFKKAEEERKEESKG